MNSNEHLSLSSKCQFVYHGLFMNKDSLNFKFILENINSCRFWKPQFKESI